ncbi:MAG: alanine--tRNA ligase, partial [Gammaproteobacteria bacterium]|nr:alanine--tRNA ligase [Gammaproteobacteria bacterium]
MSTTSALREQFLDFFHARGHQVVASDSLVPSNDPTLLFTNAGMVPFKELFLGREQRAYQRACSSQRCVRAGGKHNDLENVGYTARHHTFFEMLGNFSFGDYFKEEAIAYAWEFLTVTLKLPKERLWVTVFEEDRESEQIWLDQIGIDPKRLARIGAKDNFWQMGDTGPCGPCTEIFYDHGANVAGGPPGTPEEEGDRYIEIWNLVFMQYDRSAEGELSPLPHPCVDTGMGLERLAAVLQSVHSNYDIDLFQHLIKAAAELTSCADLQHNSLKVIADHIRSCAFLIVDGVLPSNEGRGYVLRRIIRRAARHGNQLGVKEPFLCHLVAALCEQMGAAYPELLAQRAQVERVLRAEEERFNETLEQGMKILDAALLDLDGSQIPGAVLFKLYDTYGFPLDLTADIARERGLSIDQAGFEAEMEAQRQRARAASQFGANLSGRIQNESSTVFEGYDHLAHSATVVALYCKDQPVEQVSAEQEAVVILDQTPFYAESGGQVGDRGVLSSAAAQFLVSDTQKQGSAFLHLGCLQNGELSVGDVLSAQVDEALRDITTANHSATHLLHAALRKIVGEHVHQKGSLVNADGLRFDFSHFEPLSSEQLREIEGRVNQQIRANVATDTQEMDMDAAVERGAMALFGEKYGDAVRVVAMGDFSVELCGGTHVKQAGEIGLFKITSEAGIASGVRRIEAITGARACAHISLQEMQLMRTAQLLKAPSSEVADKVTQLLEKNRRLEKSLETLKGKMASQAGSDLVSQAVEIGGLKLLVTKLDGVDNKTLRDTVDQLKQKLGSAAVVLATVESGKVKIVAGVSKDQTKRLKAGDLVNQVAQQVGGRGGGRPDMAQAGGSNPSNLEQALASVA